MKCAKSSLINDYLIFSSKLIDTIERQKRRELADITSFSADSTSMLFLPYFPGENDSVKMEPHLVLFSVAGNRYPDLEAVDHLRYLPFEDLLVSLWEYQAYGDVDILFDKDAQSLRNEREIMIDVLLQCYPGIEQKSKGVFFDLYHLDREVLGAPICYSPTAPKTIMPEEGEELQENKPIAFIWDAGDISTNSYEISIESKRPDIYWVEAEDVFQGAGWLPDTQSEYGFTVETESVYGFTGGGFLVEDGRAGETQYILDILSQGQYRVWIRSFTRLENDQHNYLSINGEVVEFAKNSRALKQWIWEDVGTFNLQAGSLPLSLSLTYDNDEMFSVYIDSIVLTTDLTYNPEENDAWEKMVSTGEIQGVNIEKLTLTEMLPRGNYRWQVRCFDGDLLVNEYGERGIVSASASFVVTIFLRKSSMFQFS